VECNKDVKKYLGQDRMQSSLPELQKVIEEDKIKVLLYNGQFDMKDGPLGTQGFLQTIPLAFSSLWNKINPRQIVNITHEGEELIAAYLRESGKVSFVVVTSAGHFSPMDNPIGVFNLLKTWVSHDKLCDGLPCFSDYAPACRLLNNCNSVDGKGKCKNGQCFCNDGWTGADCSFSLHHLSSSNATTEDSIDAVDSDYYTLDASSFCPNDAICQVTLTLNVKPAQANSLELFITGESPSDINYVPLFSFTSLLLPSSSFTVPLSTSRKHIVEVKNPTPSNQVSYILQVKKFSSGFNFATVFIPMALATLLLFVIIFVCAFKSPQKSDSNPGKKKGGKQKIN